MNNPHVPATFLEIFYDPLMVLLLLQWSLCVAVGAAPVVKDSALFGF
jgi:hypothetical protein